MKSMAILSLLLAGCGVSDDFEAGRSCVIGLGKDEIDRCLAMCSDDVGSRNAVGEQACRRAAMGALDEEVK